MEEHDATGIGNKETERIESRTVFMIHYTLQF